MNDTIDNGTVDKNAGAFIGRLVYRFGLLAVACAGAYASLWVKANVPSREQFEALSAQVQSVQEEVFRRPDYRETLKDFEQRLRDLERKFPALPPRRAPALP
jgi:hypothetical protein